MKLKLHFTQFTGRIAIKNPFFRVFAMFLLFAFLNLEVGCTYFKVNKIEDLNAELSKQNLDAQQKNSKYIIVHKDGFNYHLFNIQIDKDNMTLKASYETTPAEHSLYIPWVETNKRYINKRGQWNVLNEVHIISDSIIVKQGNTIEIPLAAVKRIDIIEKDSGRTVASYVFGIIGIAAGCFIIVMFLLLLFKSSCPFVYVHDGQSYFFKGELFGGAIFKPLERDDYMPLTTLHETDSLFHISITNELKERQYINTAEVILAEHNPGEKMLIDLKGNLHVVSSPQPAYEAKLNANDDCLKQLAFIDSSSCLFNAEGRNHNINELVLKFKNPAKASSAKLILNAKNSLWLDFAFGEMTKLFGIYYNKWIEQKRNEDPAKLRQWVTEQYLPLSVYLKGETGWNLVEQIPTIGPLAARDLCVPLNIGNYSDENVEVKLVCGFMFWEMDYAAIDFSADKNFTATVLKPVMATDENGSNVTNLVANSDHQYLFQPVPGCEASISYRLPELNGKKQYDVFLHSRGYYEHVRNYPGLPDKNLLLTFKKEGAFDDFSKDLYDRINANISLTSANGH